MSDREHHPLGSPSDVAGEIAVVAAATAVTAPIAGVGGLVAQGVIAIRNNIVLRRWLDAVDTVLERHDRLLDPDDPLAIAAFNRLTIGALQTTRQEKHEYLAEALSNCGSNSPTPDHLQVMFADLAVRYSLEHVTYLYVAAEPSQWLRQVELDPDSDLSMTLEMATTGFIVPSEEDWALLFDSYWKDLHSDGMILNEPGPAMNVGGMQPYVTSKGRRFLRFLGRDVEV